MLWYETVPEWRGEVKDLRRASAGGPVTATPRRTYGGQSADARRSARRARLLDAAIDAIADNAWRTMTVDRLCAAAGLNKRYFYESFANLDEVAAAAVDDIADDVRSATVDAAARTAAEPLDRQALAVVDALVRALVDDPRRGRILLGGVAGSAALQQHRAKVMRSLTAVLVSHARNVHGVELEKDPLATVAPAFLVGGTADAILAYLNGRARVSIDDLVTALTTLWLITGNGAAEVARHRLGD